MPSQPTSVSPEVERRAADLLGGISGTDVRVTARQPVAQGWSATGQDFPWLARLRLEDWPSAPSVVVKTQRPHDHWRGTDTIMRERAALLLLQQLGCTVAPRLLAAEHDVGFVVLEDLGAGPAVEDVLVGDDRPAAIRAYLAHALALADLQSATVGHADSFYERLPASVDPALDRVSVQVMPLRERWGRLRGLIAARPTLPAADPAEDDIAAILDWLDAADDLLVLSNGDFMPQNSRVLDERVRLLDFEGATFQHALLDAAQLRIPYAAAPAWSRLPSEVVALGETAYRERLCRTCPMVGDDRTYETGVAAAVTAWTVNRLTRLPRLEDRDKPHPLGYSRRGQLLDLLNTAVDACRAANTLPRLRGWLEDLAEVLRRRWPGLPDQQPLYPAFCGSPSTLQPRS